ncbi:protein arginine N-methyltransferase 5-like [Mercenaria mercenaria]|uniref:protein arginine N-methyltransferase 5-like n=1 Tax=Mercenaria mercenaria TaxID=6596 RepID=UPI00234EED02|nr:protein arginine N-methyltransferase 5-like [Mercenaria mercenaria]
MKENNLIQYLLADVGWAAFVILEGFVMTLYRSGVDRANVLCALKEELNYATHLGMPAVMLYLKSRKITNLARCLNEHLLSGYFQQQFWVHVPLKAPVDCVEDLFDEEPMTEERATEDSWEWWNTFRTMCDTNKRISVALEITEDLPEEEVLQRWLSEPVKAVVLSTSLFLTNKKGYPVLSKAHQGFLRSLFKLDVQLILTGANKHADKGIHSYQQYLDHLWQAVFSSPRNDILADEIDCLWQGRETLPTPDTVTQFAKGYEDYLQCPLQPLMDNLESQTYEIFEKDPIKYSQYQKAVYCALLDKIKPENKDTESVVLMVVGAGRGPLVRASLAAASQADRNIRKVYAVEKNPNAVVTLENLRDEMWGDKVEVISCDMRQWNAPEKADILVSELLGSFGDNELSPECLDGAQRFLKDDGISIPCEYTSYLAPLQSSKLYNEVRSSKDKDKPPETNFEMPYVVRLHNCQILAEPKPVFHFKHPNRDEVIDNTRYKTMEFDVDKTSILHGFAGYFDTKLYGNVYLSIVPETHSPGMFSWFPILFPVKVIFQID